MNADQSPPLSGGDASAEAARSGSRWWLVLGSALALMVGTGPVIQFSFGVFMKPLEIGLQSDRGTLALAPALGLLLMGLVTPMLGSLTDRLGLRRVVPLCVVGTAASFALLSTTTNVVAFIALYCIGSAFAGGYSPMPFAKALSARFEQRRGLALGLAMAGVGVGTAIVPLIAQQLISAWGWRVGYLGLGGIILVVALIPTMLTLPDLRNTRGHAPVALSYGASAGEALRNGVFWKLAIAFACVALATTGVMTHITALLSDRGIAPGIAATALSVGGLALIVGRVLSGYLVDKLFAPRVAMVFFSSALIGISLLLASTTASTAWIATALIGISLGAEVDLIAYLISRYLGQRAFGAIYGYLFLAFTLGTALGPLGMGQSYARTGSYSSAMIVYALGLVLACVLIARLGAYRFQTDGTPDVSIEGANPE